MVQQLSQRRLHDLSCRYTVRWFFKLRSLSMRSRGRRRWLHRSIDLHRYTPMFGLGHLHHRREPNSRHHVIAVIVGSQLLSDRGPMCDDHSAGCESAASNPGLQLARCTHGPSVAIMALPRPPSAPRDLEHPFAFAESHRQLSTARTQTERGCTSPGTRCSAL